MFYIYLVSVYCVRFAEKNNNILRAYIIRVFVYPAPEVFGVKSATSAKYFLVSVDVPRAYNNIFVRVTLVCHISKKNHAFKTFGSMSWCFPPPLVYVRVSIYNFVRIFAFNSTPDCALVVDLVERVR